MRRSTACARSPSTWSSPSTPAATLFGGGFIGVDVFFVLSGYLVTQVLLRDLAAPGGRVGFGRFYARRFRRLLPGRVGRPRRHRGRLRGGRRRPPSARRRGRRLQGRVPLRRQLVLHRASPPTTSPPTSTPSPVLHFWSLAVEEQFYLVWPLLLARLWAWSAGAARRHGPSWRRRRRSSPSPRWRPALALRCSGTNARPGPTTAPTPAPTSSSPAPRWRCSPGLTAAAGSPSGRALLAPAGAGRHAVLASSLFELDPFDAGRLATVAAAALIVGSRRPAVRHVPGVRFRRSPTWARSPTAPTCGTGRSS